MSKYGAVENQMDGMIRDIEELRAENEKLKAENKKLKRNRVFIPKPTDFSGDGILFAPEGLKQLYNGEEVEKIVKERKDLKTELRSKVDYIHEQDEVIKEYKHRAEVAEKALNSACFILAKNYYTEGKEDWAKRGAECATFYREQAEKELAEEENK